MALQTSGAISFSQIASHFGGSGSHSLSEYRALAGKGVSGIPSSGTISFSHFYGKSNQVITSVWVPSGYNSTSWQYWKNVYSPSTAPGSAWVWGTELGYSWIDINSSIGLGFSGYQAVSIGGSGTTGYGGGYQFRRSTHRYTSRSGRYRWYAFNVYRSVTTWVDTSSYQNQTTTAQITT